MFQLKYFDKNIVIPFIIKHSYYFVYYYKNKHL